MKSIIAYALCGAMFAITVGVLGMSHISATTFGLAGDVPTTNQDGMKITGHITLVATDPNGNIKAYRQTDNIVVNGGADCVTRLLFGGTTSARGSGTAGAGTSCVGALTQPWTVIAIGTGTTTEAATNTGLQTELTSGGLSRQGPTTNTVYTNATAGTSTAVISTQFSSTSTAAVTESGLFNSTTVAGSGMFAHKVFSAINLVSGDKLTVTWTVNTS